ncbi:MAG: DUF4340 domain-containing protein [Deltaproteobacteria bacterium]|nr:DUF4340 domain-containing protein [Deltaproteobacteria bacterium]
MNWEKNRLMIAGVAFVGLLAIAFFALKAREDADGGGRDGETEEEEELPELPAIERDSITALEISRPADEEGAERESVRLEKDGDTWRVTQPLESEADTTAVNTVLEKLENLEVTGIAATRAANHERLEVDEAGTIGVVVEQEGAEPVTLYIGAFSDQGTMVRLPDEDRVLTVGGSIKYAFNKDLKDWRNRRVVDIPPPQVAMVTFESTEGGTWSFQRNAEDEWAPVEGQEEIERFGANKVQSVVSSVSRMRAVNFGAPEIDAAAAGLVEPSGTVTLQYRPEAEGDEEPAADAPLQTVVLKVGGPREGAEELYLQREGDPTIYVISKYLADRMRPNAESFQTPEGGEEPAGGGMPPGMPPGMPGMGGPGGPGGGQIPPELMQQIQQQIQQQQGAHP